MNTVCTYCEKPVTGAMCCGEVGHTKEVCDLCGGDLDTQRYEAHSVETYVKTCTECGHQGAPE